MFTLLWTLVAFAFFLQLVAVLGWMLALYAYAKNASEDVIQSFAIDCLMLQAAVVGLLALAGMLPLLKHLNELTRC